MLDFTFDPIWKDEIDAETKELITGISVVDIGS